MIRVYLAVVVSLLLVNSAHAADIVTDVRSGSDGSDVGNGGYFEFGVDLNLFVNRENGIINAAPIMAGAYRYRRFFLEASRPGISLNTGTVGGITLGANIWRNERWAVDLLGASPQWRLSRRTLREDASNSMNPELEKALLDRRTFYNGAGIRLTGYFGNTLFQYRMVSDTHNGNGVTSSARIGYSRQAKNWNFHGVIGANHVSQKTGQFWYGVSEEEASTRFPQYIVRASTISYSGEFGASFPVRENVVFRSIARYSQFADALAKSPLQEGEFEFSWSNSLSYVF